jgi:hypothetical protein
MDTSGCSQRRTENKRSHVNRQSVLHSPWHLNSFPRSPILPPHSGHIQFKILETISVVLTLPNLINAILTSSVTHECSAIGVMFRNVVPRNRRHLASSQIVLRTREVHFEFQNSETLKLDQRFLELVLPTGETEFSSTASTRHMAISPGQAPSQSCLSQLRPSTAEALALLHLGLE